MADLIAKVQAGRLLDLHKLLSSLDRVASVTIDVDPAGLGVDVTDPAHIAMVAVLMDKTAFELYQLGDQAPYQMCIDLDRLKNALQRATSKDVIELTLDGARLDVHCNTLDWRMRLGQVDGHRPTLPKWDVAAKGLVPVADLVTCSKVAACVSDFVSLQWREEKLLLATTTEQDEVEMRLEPITAVKGEADCVIPLDYFQAMVKALPQETVMLELATDKPLACAVDGSGIHGKYYIAPRIADGD